jgi:hypothetical protein
MSNTLIEIKNIYTVAGFEVLTAVSNKMVVFRERQPCRLEEIFPGHHRSDGNLRLDDVSSKYL